MVLTGHNRLKPGCLNQELLFPGGTHATRVGPLCCLGNNELKGVMPHKQNAAMAGGSA